MPMRRAANLWIGLLVGLLGALVSAQQPLDLGIPSNAIAFFDATTATGCPTGWTELTTARGFYVVGLPNGGTKATTVASALTDLEDRHHTHSFAHTHTMVHTHTYSITSGLPSSTTAKTTGGQGISTNTHTHIASGTTSGESTPNTGAASTSTSGNESTTITPYIEELLCKKT